MMKQKINFMLFAMVQCVRDKNLGCLGNAINTLKFCRENNCNLIMIYDILYHDVVNHAWDKFIFNHCDFDPICWDDKNNCMRDYDDIIAIMLSNVNDDVYVIDDYCEWGY